MPHRRPRQVIFDQATLNQHARTYVRVAIAFLVVSLIPLAIFAVMLKDDLDLRDQPRVAARVVEVLHERTSSKGPPETSSLRLEFTPQEGRIVSAVVRTTRSGVAVGDLVRISYDPANHRRVRTVEGSELPWRVPLIIAGTIAFLGLCSLWLALTIRIGRPSRWYPGSRPSD